MHGGGEKHVQGFGWEAKRKETTLKTKVRVGSKSTSGRLVEGVWSGFTWLRIGIIGGLL
jgi:hypothetical protein